MPDDIHRFEVGAWTPDLFDGSPESEALGRLCFGSQWEAVKARAAKRPKGSGGRLTVTRVDRDAGVITVKGEK